MADLRPWHGTAAAEDELDDHRAWVVWGTSAPADRAAVPEDAPPEGATNEIARRIATTNDSDWAQDPGPTWISVVEGDEHDVHVWMLDDESVCGYAPYLIAEDADVPSSDPMRGVLRNDVVRRRPFDAARTNERESGT